MPASETQAAIARARRAQAEVEFWPQERVDELVTAAAWPVYEEGSARFLSLLAQRETGLGDADHMFTLHRRRVLGALRDLHGVTTTGVIEELPHQGLVKIAKPVGVIAVASPATAPCSTVIGNALPMLKTRNAVVFSPNPRAQQATVATVDLLRGGLARAGAPEDLIQCVTVTGRETVEDLMAAADLVVAAGGSGTVARSYRSGTPAITAGAGNPPVIVDDSADVSAAAELIVHGASFNHGTSCSSESNVLADAVIAGAFKKELRCHGAYLCDGEETARLRALLWPTGNTLSRAAIGRSAADIAADIGIPIGRPAEIAVLVAAGPAVRGTVTGLTGDPLLGEKLSPVLTLLEYDGFDTALSAVDELLAHAGRGHSCGIHTTRAEHVESLAGRARVCRVMVNQSTATGNSGSFNNGMPFTSTIASGSWGGCSRSENITWRHFLNYTYVSRPLPLNEPDEETLFGAYRRQLPLSASY